MLDDNVRKLRDIDTDVLDTFLYTIFASYKEYNVSYHNDMHCLDVAQMSHILLKTGPDCIVMQLKLSHLEQFATIIACLCHDYAHDGFNNAYHVNGQTERFITHGKDGVQEKFHFAESFKVIEQTGLLSGLNRSEQALFKKRMQGCILATDMARHMKDLTEMKDILESIPEGESLISDQMSEEEKEKRRAKVCELVVHASDISFLARTWEN